MPIHEYVCPAGHLSERLFTTFGEAAKKKDEPINCTECGMKANLKEFSVPLPAHFYGNPDGYYKPSPTKRHSTKLVSAKEGNTSSIG